MQNEGLPLSKSGRGGRVWQGIEEEEEEEVTERD